MVTFTYPSFPLIVPENTADDLLPKDATICITCNYKLQILEQIR